MKRPTVRASALAAGERWEREAIAAQLAEAAALLDRWHDAYHNGGQESVDDDTTTFLHFLRPADSASVPRGDTYAPNEFRQYCDSCGKSWLDHKNGEPCPAVTVSPTP